MRKKFLAGVASISAALMLVPSHVAGAEEAPPRCSTDAACFFKDLLYDYVVRTMIPHRNMGCVDIPESQSAYNTSGWHLKLWKNSNCTGEWTALRPGEAKGAQYFTFDGVTIY